MDITTTPSYDPVYQLETTDLVLGGSGAIANDQAQALGNRTDWLLMKSGLELFDSATMSASYPSVVPFTPVHGTLYQPSGNAATYVLPPIASVADGTTFAVLGRQYGGLFRVYIQGFGGERIYGGVDNYGLLNVQTVWAGETLVITKSPGATQWTVLARHGDVKAGIIAQLNFVPSLSLPWINCAGSTISTTDYPRLFAQIGYNFGGSGSSFGVPFIASSGSGAAIIYYVIHV